jgi:single-strand DNA-binding protein
MQLLGGREGGADDAGHSREPMSRGDSGGGARERDNAVREPEARAQRPAPSRPAPAPKAATGFDDMDDDIPF